MEVEHGVPRYLRRDIVSWIHRTIEEEYSLAVSLEERSALADLRVHGDVRESVDKVGDGLHRENGGGSREEGSEEDESSCLGRDGGRFEVSTPALVGPLLRIGDDDLHELLGCVGVDGGELDVGDLRRLPSVSSQAALER